MRDVLSHNSGDVNLYHIVLVTFPITVRKYLTNNLKEGGFILLMIVEVLVHSGREDTVKQLTSWQTESRVE